MVVQFGDHSPPEGCIKNDKSYTEIGQNGIDYRLRLGKRIGLTCHFPMVSFGKSIDTSKVAEIKKVHRH